MPSIQILYDAKDHQSRAEALKVSLANDANADVMDTTPVKVPGLKTLVIWGHGSHTGLCEKNAREVVTIIGKWKDKNLELEAVEIITCNSRHFNDSWLKGTEPTRHLKSLLTHALPGKKVNNSMAKQVKRGLKYSIYPSLRRIKVLSMPQAAAGHFNQSSILLWDPPSTSWAYVTGSSEAEMFKMTNNIKLTKRHPPSPDYIWGKPRTGDLPSRVEAGKLDFPGDDWTDVKSGNLGDLRNLLVEVN